MCAEWWRQTAHVSSRSINVGERVILAIFRPKLLTLWRRDVSNYPFWHTEQMGEGDGLSVWNKKISPSSCHPTRNSSSFRLISFFFFFFFDQFLLAFGDVCEDVMPCGVSPRAAETAVSIIYLLKALKIDGNKNRKDTSDDRHKLAVVDAP